MTMVGRTNPGTSSAPCMPAGSDADVPITRLTTWVSFSTDVLRRDRKRLMGGSVTVSWPLTVIRTEYRMHEGASWWTLMQLVPSRIRT